MLVGQGGAGLMNLFLLDTGRNKQLWLFSVFQAQFIFKKIRAASNVTGHSIMFLGNVAWGADCETLQQQTLDSEFLELVRFLSGQHGEIRQSLVQF
ncbi:hypothetical protein scyTo_0024871 [Scyliorhinus torazame]|uniref:Uncharacterized protein n=1 Tax=Scyliorhinus torazame TaxID=75743 RepID=A0A401QG79_SCYTO|nr:hypothetical protein [Scyliorhinus torazame]